MVFLISILPEVELFPKEKGGELLVLTLFLSPLPSGYLVGFLVLSVFQNF